MTKEEFIEAVKAKLAEMVGGKDKADAQIASVSDAESILDSEYRNQKGRSGGDSDALSWRCAVSRVAEDFADWY